MGSLFSFSNSDRLSAFNFSGAEKLIAVPSGDFAIGQEQLSIMTRDHNNNALQQFGGASLASYFPFSSLQV